MSFRSKRILTTNLQMAFTRRSNNVQPGGCQYNQANHGCNASNHGQNKQDPKHNHVIEIEKSEIVSQSGGQEGWRFLQVERSLFADPKENREASQVVLIEQVLGCRP